jgi:hypothetical protein
MQNIFGCLLLQATNRGDDLLPPTPNPSEDEKSARAKFNAHVKQILAGPDAGAAEFPKLKRGLDAAVAHLRHENGWRARGKRLLRALLRK